jgi:DeoR/GlpR family transcriptional regulator of sugar metabolism
MQTNSKIDIRREKMLELIQRSPVTTINDLADFFSVSAETVRKDIEYLDERDLIIRIHGGVAPKVSKGDEKSFNLRYSQNLDKKMAIAEAACNMITPGDSIIIENGTTLQELAKVLVSRPELLKTLIIVTMSFRILEILKDSDFGKVFFLGGWVRKDDYMSYGQHTISLLKEFHVDKAFIGCAGLDRNLEITDYFDEEVMLRRQIIASCDKSILLADSSKMNKTILFSVCSLKDIYRLITDKECDKNMTKIFDNNNINYKLV